MTPHTQGILADPVRNDGHDANGVPGDCYRTAIACIIDAEHPTDVPHFVAEGEQWWDAVQEWAKSRGETVTYLPVPVPDDWAEWWGYWSKAVEHAVLSGPSPRGPFAHAVVGTPDLQVIHDPHPSRAGLTKVTGVEIFLPSPQDDE